jgi:hypothetical protein
MSPRRYTAFVIFLFLLPVALAIVGPGVEAQATLTIKFTNLKEDEIVGGDVTVRGEATGASIVELKFDAEDAWRTANGASAWDYGWDTSSFSDGAHTVFARARNGTATSDTVSVRVYVDNSPPEYITLDVSATPLDVGPAENITISGFVEYDTGVMLKGVTVTMDIQGEGISATGTTDENGYFIEVLSSPTDAGKYTILVSTTDGTLDASREFALKVTTPYQPDLKVTKIELNPPEPRTDDTVDVYATIDNIGEQAASAKVNFYVDGNLMDSKNANVDKTKVVKGVWIAKPGAHTIKVVVTDVDPIDRDESNNELSIGVTPRSEPEVVIVDVILSNPAPRQGQQVSVQVRLENKGDAGTTGTVKVYDGAPSMGVVLMTASFSIEANESRSVFMIWSPQKGDHTLYAVIEVVGEASKPEHTQTETVTVLPPVKKKEDTPGFGPAVMLLSVVAAALALGGRGRARYL